MNGKKKYKEHMKHFIYILRKHFAQAVPYHIKKREEKHCFLTKISCQIQMKDAHVKVSLQKKISGFSQAWVSCFAPNGCRRRHIFNEHFSNIAP